MGKTKNIFYDDSNRLKTEIKMGLVIDDYKLPEKDSWWAKSLDKLPEGKMDRYEFDREEIIAGPTKGVSSIFRYYLLKNNN